MVKEIRNMVSCVAGEIPLFNSLKQEILHAHTLVISVRLVAFFRDC